MLLFFSLGHYFKTNFKTLIEWTNTVRFHIHKVFRIVKFIQTVKTVVTRGWGRKGMGSYRLLGRVSFGKSGKFWKWMVVMAAQQCECT